MVLRDDFYATVQQFGLGAKRRVHCRAVGFHPRNRGKLGLQPSECRVKLKGFVAGGFSASECDRAVTVQRPSGEKGIMFETKNAEVARKSDFLIPEVGEGTLESFTLTCSHTNLYTIYTIP